MTRKELAKARGFVLRVTPYGDFINRGGDDLMCVRAGSKQVVVYEHDADAFHAASCIAQLPEEE